MNLDKLLQGLEVKSTVGQLDRSVGSVVTDHRKIQTGSVWVCYRGVLIDAHQFMAQAIDKRPIAIIAENSRPIRTPTNIAYIQVGNSRSALARIAANWHGQPAEGLDLIGITGTNGKTSTAHFIASIFRLAHLEPALIGTIGYYLGRTVLPAQSTTPDPLTLHSLFAQIHQNQIRHVIMEASSQGLDQRRLDHLKFQVAVFTNLTQDHLDYHGSMKDYLVAKARLFRQIVPTGLAVINCDLSPGITNSIAAAVQEKSFANVITYGLNGQPNVTATNISQSKTGLSFQLLISSGSEKQSTSIRLKLFGQYNIYNALAAVSVALHYQINLSTIKKGLESTVIPGRCEAINLGQPFTVIVDYAHTPDGLRNLLRGIRIEASHRLIVVFGCGGDRDSTKRSLMGKAASEIADYTILTSDNPRSEQPMLIIEQILSSVRGQSNFEYDVILDRKRAIQRAVEIAEVGDFVIIAGKGHESYQEIGDMLYPFDDRQVVTECLTNIL